MLHSLRKPNVRRALIALFFAAFLTLGLVTAADYGRPWDEHDEMDILRMNMLEYARAFNLDDSRFDYWAQPNGISINELVPISVCPERDHGISAFYPLASVVLDSSMPEPERQKLWHMYCWVLFTLGAFALYCCCRNLGLSEFIGLAAAAILVLSPRFFAEGHYNNKDVVLMSLTLCTLWQGLRLARKPSVNAALLFALFGALAANTKLAGLALWGLCALYVLIVQIRRKALKGKVLAVGGVTLAGFIAFYALLTPALWRSPIGYFIYILKNALQFNRWEWYVRFCGINYTNLPSYYLPYMIFATTPLWVLLLIAAGQAAVIGRLFSRKNRSELSQQENESRLALLLITLMWFVPLAFAVITHTKVYNSWRHFYFIYAPLLIIAAYGLDRLFKRLKGMKPKWLKPAFAVMLALCAAFTGIGTALNHPYQYAYYQPLELMIMPDEDYQEYDYWNISVQDALRELCAVTDGEITIAGADYWTKAGLKRGAYTLPGELRSRLKLKEAPDDSDYILLNPTYALFSGFEPTGLTEIVKIEAYGHTIMSIYSTGAGQ